MEADVTPLIVRLVLVATRKSRQKRFSIPTGRPGLRLLAWLRNRTNWPLLLIVGEYESLFPDPVRLAFSLTRTVVLAWRSRTKTASTRCLSPATRLFAEIPNTLNLPS